MPTTTEPTPQTGLLPETGSSESCCSTFYEQDWVRNLAEDIFHPGGEDLTRRTIAAMHLPESARIADLGCGTGATAVLLAGDYGFQVSAVDISAVNIERAVKKAKTASVSVCFSQSDVQHLPYAEDELDGLIAECTFSLFKQQSAVLAEIRRVLRPGGKLAITDMATGASLPDDIAAVRAPWTCLAGAVDQETYVQMFETAGFKIDAFKDESAALTSLVGMLKRKLLLLGAGVIMHNGSKHSPGFPDVDLAGIRFWLDRFETEVRNGTIRYLRFNLSLAPDPVTPSLIHNRSQLLTQFEQLQ